MIKTKKQYRTKNIASALKAALREISVSAVKLETVCVMSCCGYLVVSESCPLLSLCYLLTRHTSMINVLSDLLNLFSFLLTVILFPLDRTDSTCVCARMRLCRCATCACTHLCLCKEKVKVYRKQDKNLSSLIANCFHQFLVQIIPLTVNQ